jgi:hypothetical protein
MKNRRQLMRMPWAILTVVFVLALWGAEVWAQASLAPSQESTPVATRADITSDNLQRYEKAYAACMEGHGYQVR